MENNKWENTRFFKVLKPGYFDWKGICEPTGAGVVQPVDGRTPAPPVIYKTLQRMR